MREGVYTYFLSICSLCPLLKRQELHLGSRLGSHCISDINQNPAADSVNEVSQVPLSLNVAGVHDLNIPFVINPRFYVQK